MNYKKYMEEITRERAREALRLNKSPHAILEQAKETAQYMSSKELRQMLERGINYDGSPLDVFQVMEIEEALAIQLENRGEIK